MLSDTERLHFKGPSRYSLCGGGSAVVSGGREGLGEGGWSRAPDTAVSRGGEVTLAA